MTDWDAWRQSLNTMWDVIQGWNDPWLSTDLFRDVVLITIWTLFASSIVQGSAHMIGWASLRSQRDQTQFGQILKTRELTLGLKALGRSLWEFLLASAITWQIGYGETNLLLGTLLLITVFSLVAIVWAIRFVKGLEDEGALRLLRTAAVRRDRRAQDEAERERREPA